MSLTCLKLIVIISLLFSTSLIYMTSYMAFSPLSCHWSKSNSRRIALIADPQMEGDTKVYHQGTYGLINNYFNDYYFKLIFQNVHYVLRPDSVFVLGDLFSSQHVSNEEFYLRLDRYNAIFSGMFGFINRLFKMRSGDLHEEQRMQQARGENDLRNLNFPYLVNLTGNHDVGYGFEANFFRIQRFIASFGIQNRKDIIYENGKKKVLAVTINSMVLDGGADGAEETATTDHLQNIIKMKEELKDDLDIVLFTHIPLHKPKGVCVDGPFIRWSEDNLPIEQNFLTPKTSQIILTQLKPKYIFNGHDHFGCKYTHKEGAQEFTVKSVQGDFAGNVGLFEIEKSNDGFNYHYKDCEYYPTKYIVGYLASLGLWIVIVTLVIVLRIIKFILCCEFIGERKAKQD